MNSSNHNNYYALQIIPDDATIYRASNNKLWNGRNTWKDWHLIPSSRPVINPPTIKSNYIDIPGGNGTIDASTILTTYPVYNDREGQIEYYVARNYSSYDSWVRVYHTVMNYTRGKRFKVIMEEDPGYYYRGRVSVNQWKSEKDWSKIVLDYHFEPFKYEVLRSVDRWRWDPFSFITGIITPEQKVAEGEEIKTIYYDVAINNSSRTTMEKTVKRGSETVKNPDDSTPLSGTPLRIIAGTMPISPTFTVSCETPIVSGNAVSLRILQLREYSDHYEVISESTIEFTNSNPKTFSIYDLNIYDEDGVIFFNNYSVFANYTFKATVQFRRGWL